MTWERSTLGDIASWSSGGTPSAGTASFYGGDIPWLIIGDLNDGAIATASKTITDEGLANSSAKWVPQDAVLVAMYGSIGKLGLTQFPVTTNQAIAAAVGNGRVIPKFLFYYLLSQRASLAAAGKGATQKNIGQGTLKAWPISFPSSLDEQRRIVELVEEHLSHLDAANAALRASLARLEALNNACLSSAYSGVESYPSEPLVNLLAPTRKIAYGVLVPGPHINGGVPLVRVGDLNGDLRPGSLKKIAPGISAKFPRTILRGGEVLLSVVGTIGRVAVAPPELADCNVARAVAVLPFNDQVDPYFAAGFLQLPRTKQALEGAAHEVARKTLNLEDVRQVCLPLPPMELQRDIAARAAGLKVSITRLQVALEEGETRSNALRRAVLTAAFSGRLTGHSPIREVLEELAEVAP